LRRTVIARREAGFLDELSVNFTAFPDRGGGLDSRLQIPRKITTHRVASVAIH
jgi:hypothetical protein